MWFLIFWLISIFWAICFIPWCIDKRYSPVVILIMFCPILNTVFAACRTYHFIMSPNNKSWESFKDLFAK